MGLRMVLLVVLVLKETFYRDSFQPYRLKFQESMGERGGGREISTK